MTQPHNRKPLQDELARTLNCYSAENGSNTPDFILAKFLLHVLDGYNGATMAREEWYGRLDDDTARDVNEATKSFDAAVSCSQEAHALKSPPSPPPSVPPVLWNTVDVRCVECPGCLFTFAEAHTNEHGGYVCPVCCEGDEALRVFHETKASRARANAAVMGDESKPQIDIVFAGDDLANLTFVEVERDGFGFKLGEWMERSGGLAVLRIDPALLVPREEPKRLYGTDDQVLTTDDLRKAMESLESGDES